jgi:hypothetical protein
MLTTPENAFSHSAAEGTTSGQMPGIQRPLLLLLVILTIALALRYWHLNDPLQRDEFGTLYAVAERQTDPGTPPTADDPLVPVASREEVRARSVLPFGISNPIPVYNYIVYETIKVFGITEWSLRLPSLLAGLGCVAGLYFLCRRLISVEMGLVAAALAAVEMIQRDVSVMARPYAIGNLACVLSFAALLGALYARRSWAALLCALGYGLTVALMGYMNPLLLLVVVAHFGIVIYWLFGRKHLVQDGGPAAAMGALWWATGCVVAALLLWPVAPYMVSVQTFAYAHSDYMLKYDPRQLQTIFRHNSTFLVALLVVYVAAYIVGQQMGPRSEAPEDVDDAEDRPSPTADEPRPAAHSVTAAPGSGAAAGTAISPSPAAESVPAPAGTFEPPPLDSPDAIWVGRLWLFLPQLAAIMLAYGAAEAIFVSRFLSYTTLGGLLILAYWATRERSRDVRLAVCAATVLAVFLMGFLGISHGFRLNDGSVAWKLSNDIDKLKSFEAGDVLLLRSSLMEGDFLHDEVPEENRRHVEGVIKAPLTTLYGPTKPVRIIVLTKSHNTERARTVAGHMCHADQFYTAELGKQLHDCPKQFWIVNDDVPEFGKFLSCFLPWLADQAGCELSVARNRPRESANRYFTVPADSRQSDFLDGLTNQKPKDFETYLIRVQPRPPRRPWPRVFTNLMGLSPPVGPAANVGAGAGIAWFIAQDRKPRVITSPEEPGDDETK